MTKKILKSVLETWDKSTDCIMDSQKRYNEEALAWSKPRIEKWIGELDNA